MKWESLRTKNNCVKWHLSSVRKSLDLLGKSPIDF